MVGKSVALVLIAVLAATTAQATSCRDEVGAVRAQAYVDMCSFFSGATHPPCNAANSCAMMQVEIDTGCTDKAKCAVPTVPGTWKCSDARCSSYGFTPD